MKDIRSRLVKLLKEGYCTPQIGRIARDTHEPAATIHYNVKKLESNGTIRTYKAVFDYNKIDEGFCAYMLVALSSSEYAEPERVASDFARYGEVESVDILAGDWELLLKIRTKDQDAYFKFLKEVISKEKGIENTNSIISLTQVKTEFVLANSKSTN